MCSVLNCILRLPISEFSRKAPISGAKRKAGESADETPRVEAAIPPASMESPPRTRAHLEAAREEGKAATEAERTAAEEAEKATSVRVVRAPPASPPSPPSESPSRELFPANRDQELPEAHPAE